MTDERTHELLAEIDRLKEALQSIMNTPRRDGILACHRIAVHALEGLETRIAPRQRSLGDPIYFARVMKHLRVRWDNRCAYCGASDKPFQPDHVKPVSRGGTDEIGNLALACIDCNRQKGTQTATEFGFRHVAFKAAMTTLPNK